MAESIINRFGNNIAELTFIPSSGGVMEISVDGKLIFSKKELGRFPEISEILDAL